MSRCIYITCAGHDVVCLLKNKTLGDIMGYNGKECKRCDDFRAYNKCNIVVRNYNDKNINYNCTLETYDSNYIWMKLLQKFLEGSTK